MSNHHLSIAGLHIPGGARLHGSLIIPIVEDVVDELISASQANGSMASAHEGWAVLREEEEELWDEIKKRHPDEKAMRREAVQVAAMALRFLHDVCDD
jgi:hypothetical protein